MNSVNTIICFDLHGVVFQLNWKQVWRIFWRFPHKFKLFLCGLNIPLAWYGIRLLLNDATDVEVYALFKKYCPSVLPFVIDVTNAHKPIPETVRVIQKLKARGYALHIVSNVGPDRFKVLQERYPDIIHLFDKTQILEGTLPDLVKKPQRRFFEQYLHTFHVNPEQILFIDDNKSNIRTAQRIGFSVIRFKNPKQLLCDLCALNII